MAILRKDNVILNETDGGKVKELEARGFVKVNKNGKPLVKEIDSQKALDEAFTKLEKTQKENAELKKKIANIEKGQKEEKKETKK